MDLTLKINNLSKAHAEVLFSNVSLSVEKPQKIALIGENGSGKSTLLKILAGLETANSGEVLWGKDVKLGYLEQEIGHDLDTASGGEKKVIKLAQTFYSDNNFILLDEPDNHLDLENKAWFESLVKDFDGTVIIISHDRAFLRNCVDKIWLLEEKMIKEYPFNYEKFGMVYGEEMEARNHLWETQEKERLRLHEAVNLFRVRAANNHSLAKSYHGMIKRYEKFVSEMVEKPPAVKSLNLKSNLDDAAKRKTALHLINLNKSYGVKIILQNLGVHIFCGDKIAINAPNGSGKSTLLNIIAGRTAADSGEVYVGPGLKMGCYTQEHLDALDESLTMTEELQKNMPLAWQQALGYLKRFMFTEAQINGQIKYLSGGQKSRLQLAKFLSVNPDILVLDEPTNHLDLKTVISLEKFLKDYKGTIVLVSHDRELVNKVASKNYLLVDGVLKLENDDNYETGIPEE